jgi:hypothetical protein
VNAPVTGPAATTESAGDDSASVEGLFEPGVLQEVVPAGADGVDPNTQAVSVPDKVDEVKPPSRPLEKSKVTWAGAVDAKKNVESQQYSHFDGTLWTTENSCPRD